MNAELIKFASTPRQAEILKAVLDAGTGYAAAKALGLAHQTVNETVRRVKINAAKQGYSPDHSMTKTVPEGFHVKGVSTYYDEDGNVRGQWVKSNRAEEERQEAMRLFVEELTKDVKPRKKTKAPKVGNKDLLAVYPIGDHHWGQLSWGQECGEDYDLKIAKKNLSDAVDYLVDACPPAENALLVNLGDWTHVDNRSNMTPRSGHLLDADGRYAKIAREAAYGMAHSVARILEKHRKVKIVNVPGNHDPDTASWMSLFMEAWFRNEPRVDVETSPGIYLFHQFGANMVCMTHGDKVKLPDIPQVMASLEPEMWGSTRYRMAMTGHVHHAQTISAKEGRGAIARSFGVLGPSDAHSASLGYHSQREMHALVFKRSGGVMSEVTYNVNLT